MNLFLKILLILGAFVTVISVLKNIYLSKLEIKESPFCIILSAVLFLLALFPGIADKISDLIGIKSSEKFVFFSLIVVLLYGEFKSFLKISKMELTIRNLVSKMALDSEKRLEEENNKK